ncbi:tyrosine-type recombinase/integrase [Rosistilla oblonga]|uniref:tyrosine-type recombinase/integrase n=1 Tax=Rosistilla oblonga TaxID=2527990 RepID=UPI003A987E14
MPRLTKSLPKYRKHRASGQAVVTIDGKDRYLGPHGTAVSRREYDRLVAEYLTRDRQPEASADDVLVKEILAAFWRHAKNWYVKDGKPTSELAGYRILMRDVKALYGDRPAADFGPLAFKAVRQRWIDRGLVRTGINKNAGRLKQIFKWAAAEELIDASVYHALQTVAGLRKGRSPAPESPPVLPVDLAIVQATIEHLPQVTADMIRFQLLTGARPGEVCTMTPADIDRSGEVWEYRVDGHKTEHHGRSRTIFIGPEAQAILKPYLSRQPDRVCFSMAESLEQRRQAANAKRKTPAGYGNRRGHRSGGLRGSKVDDAFNTGSYRRAIHYACDLAFPAQSPIGCREGESDAARLRRLTEKQKAELGTWQKTHRWSPNRLRHTRGTEIRKQFGLEAAQVILGHAAADVTQIYAERDAEKAREVARKIG